MNWQRFCAWFDAAPLWVVGLVTFVVAVALIGLVCGYVWAVTQCGREG